MTWKTRLRSKVPTGDGLAWIKEGAGAPLVLIHGVGLRSEAWGQQISAFASSYEVHALDMPGHGESAGFDTVTPSLGDYTDRIGAAVSSFGEPVLIAGHSMGALIALDLGVRYPQMCKGIVALNAVFRRSQSAAVAIGLRVAALRDDPDVDVHAPVRRWFGPQPYGAFQSEAESCVSWLSATDRAHYAKAYAAFAREDGPSDEGLAHMECPALFMTGGNEPNSTPAMSEAMAKLAPRGVVHIVDGANHMMPMTHVGIVNEVLVKFFASCEVERHDKN